MDNTGRNQWKSTVVKVNITDKLHEDEYLEITNWKNAYVPRSYIRIIYRYKQISRMKI